MSLAIIGIGLYDEKDITIRGLAFVKNADVVYLDHYTSILQCPVQDLERFYGKQVMLADRELVEQQADSTILREAQERNVVFLVVGDALGATTHTDLIERARHLNIDVDVVPNASIFSAVGACGLQLYKFGKTASLPFYSTDVPLETPLRTIRENQQIASHTLLLLDLDPPAGRFMTVNEAITSLLNSTKTTKDQVVHMNTPAVGCARLGSPTPTIKYGTLADLQSEDFGKPPHCLIIPGKLHFMEEESLSHFSVKRKN